MRAAPGRASWFPGVIGAYAEAFGNDIAARYIRECPDHAGLVHITEALVGRGWPETDIRQLLGGNMLRALDKIWQASDLTG